MVHKEAVIPPQSSPGSPVPHRRKEAVLNGEDRFEGDTAISDAVSSASEDDVITVGPGTYPDNITITTDGVTLSGSGYGTLIDGGAGETVQVKADDVTVMNLAGKNDVDQGSPGVPVFHVTDVDAGVTAYRASLQNLRVPSCTDGIRLNAPNGQAMNVGVFNSTGRVYVVEKTDNAVIGARYSSGSRTATRVLTVPGNKCVIVGLRGRALATDGVQVRGHRNKLIGCHIHNTDNHGWVDGSGATGNIYMGCGVTDAGGDGFVSTETRPVVMGFYANNITGTPFDVSAATDPFYDFVWADGNMKSKPRKANDVKSLVNAPNGHIEETSVGNGSDARITVPVPDGETLEVFRWGAYRTSDGATPTDLDVELIDGSGTVQATENTGNTESTDPTTPVASHTNGSGSTSIFKLAVANDTGGSVTASGVFAYRVE